MARPELGKKRTDPETGRKFYDLGKNPIVSPYTGTSYPLSFFEGPPSTPSRYAAAVAARPVHREERQEADAETRDDDTVSLTDLEEDEAEDAKSDDADDDEPVEKDGEDTFLALDEQDEGEDVNELVGERDEEEN